MKYIIMCGGVYRGWDDIPRHMININGEPIVARTIRLLRENNIEDIAISSNNDIFEQFGIPVLRHENSFDNEKGTGFWIDAFYPTNEPTCYLCGDVVFSIAAIKEIVETDTDDIMFFGSAPPFSNRYRKRVPHSKKGAEPFALKVVNTDHLKESIEMVKFLMSKGYFKRHPIMWELWQVITGTPINIINYKNYVAINDYTCDIDYPEDVEAFEAEMKKGE